MMKIFVCPFCGHNMPEGLLDGFASCDHCKRVFESSLQNRLLSASWLIKKHNYSNIEQFISHTKMPEHEAILVFSFVEDNCYSTQEFKRVLDLLGI